MVRATLAIAAALAASAFAAEIRAPAKLVTPGKLTYGFAATFAPFEFQRDGKLVGVDVDFGEEIAKRLGLAAEPMNMEFKGLIPALQGGRLDMINSAMYMTQERAQQVDFVPYLRIGTEVIVRKGNPAAISGRNNSLCGRRIAVTLGGIQETYARADDERCRNAGQPDVIVMTFPTAQDSALAVRQGRADVFYNSTPGTVMLMTEVPDVYQVVGETFEANTRLGVAVRKGHEEMRKAIEAAFQSMVKDGTYVRVIANWKLPESVVLLQ
jgi:polar amino acid transport system substrate-binding protein